MGGREIPVHQVGRLRPRAARHGRRQATNLQTQLLYHSAAFPSSVRSPSSSSPFPAPPLLLTVTHSSEIRLLLQKKKKILRLTLIVCFLGGRRGEGGFKCVVIAFAYLPPPPSPSFLAPSALIVLALFVGPAATGKRAGRSESKKASYPSSEEKRPLIVTAHSAK